tara:strand:- start:591 stop:779 length:189 start_codon:yes stop_codon:yes gene_type:complete
MDTDLTQRIETLHEKLKLAEDINQSHKELNGKLQIKITELEKDNKTLAKEVGDLTERLCKCG